MVNYTKAKKYATKCGYGLDLVHEAFLDWHKKTGNDLFNEPEHRVMAVMGWMVRRERNNGMQMWRGQKHFRKYVSFPDFEYYRDESGTNEFLLPVEPNQYKYCSYNDTVNNLDFRLKNLKGFAKTVYEYIKQDFTVAEIAKAENTYLQRVRHYVNMVKYLAGNKGYALEKGCYVRVW